MAINDSCLCGTGFNNTGMPSCIKLFKKTTGLLLVPMFDNDNNANYIDMATTIDLVAKTQDTDPSQRFYPIQGLKDVELPVAETKFETFKDGTKKKLADGVRSFKAVVPEIGSMFASKLQGVSCETFGFYQIDIEGNLLGRKVGTKLYPIKLGGWDAVFNGWTEDNTSKVMIQFDFDILVRISSFHILSSDDCNVDPNELTGLVDANITEVSSGATSAVIDIYSDYGSGLSDEPITGLVTADFSAYNDTDGASVSVTATESTTVDGRYTLAYSSQTVADLVTITVETTSGYTGNIQVTI